MSARPVVSVVIPCRNEARYITACLDSVLAADYPRDRLEVIVADGMSDDGTREILADYAATHAHVRVLDNRARITPTALNTAIRAATGDVIVRMDAHAVYAHDYIPRLVAALDATGADVVGGRLETLPGAESVMARAIAVGLSHRLGVGNSYFRIGSDTPRWVDTVPFGCFRRSVFDRVGWFDVDLVRNQDEELNARVLRAGGRVLLLPDVVVGYYGRTTLGQVARMFYQYGYFKPLVARKVGRVMTARQLVPGTFVATLAVAALLAPWFAPAAWAGAAAAAAYAAAVVPTALAAAPRCGGVRAVPALAAVFPVMHFAYGAGFWAGIRDHWLRGKRPGHGAAVRLSR